MSNRKKERKKIIILVFLFLLTFGLSGCKGAVQDTASRIRDIAIGKEETKQAPRVSEGKYAYSQLDSETAKVYNEIVYAIRNREEDRKLSTDSVEVMENAYMAMRSDYCDFFWLKKFSYVTYRRGKKIIDIHITPVYSMTEKEQASTQKKIDAEAERMLEGIPGDAGDYEKALHVYETLIMNVDYDEDSADNQNIVSVFVNHRTICQGYAYATQYLLERLGIPCTTVSGSVDGESHAWNLVKLDGNYYYMDTTWGNSQYIYREDSEQSEGGGDGEKYIDYDYFAATTAQIASTHKADGKLRLPACTSMEDNYYVREGRYFNEWNPDAVGALIREAYENGEKRLQIKFSDTELCEQAIQYFVEDYHLTDYCKGLDSVRYLENTDNSMFFLEFPDSGKRK